MATSQANQVPSLRERYYNALTVSITHIHSELMILRVKGMEYTPAYLPGQYVALGLGQWEPRLAEGGIRIESGPATRMKLIKRAYSISNPIWDEQGQLVTTSDHDYLEFYITLVSNPTDTPPSLTPRLFALQPGNPIFLGDKGRGTYTLEPVAADSNVLFVSTGTGEAPHNAMIAQLLADGHQGQICSVVCVRYAQELAYQKAHQRLEQKFDNYQYLALTTREPRNIDPAHPAYIGKQYIQQYLESGQLETVWGQEVVPEKTHVFLCGNPAMIGLPVITADKQEIYPEKTGMVELLINRGFQLDRPNQVGNIHFEKYW